MLKITDKKMSYWFITITKISYERIKMQEKIDRIKKIIAEADAVIITAGAGMGVDSGLPDFRGDHGFWKAYPPLKDKDIGFTDIANPQWFFSDPKLAWAFYGHRLNLYKNTEPHEGFRLLLDLVKSKNNNYFIYTSNVDGHFQKAGFDKDKIYECHGSIHYSQCIHNDDGMIWRMRESSVEVDETKFIATKMPVCPECGCVSRPNIMMFYDHEFNAKRTLAQHKRYEEWLEQNKDSRFVIIELGAGLAVPTIRNFGEKFVKRSKKATLIRINPRDNYISEYIGINLKCGALDSLRQILC